MPGTRADYTTNPRSNRTSSSSAPLLTPVYETDSMSENAIASSSGSSADDEESNGPSKDDVIHSLSTDDGMSDFTPSRRATRPTLPPSPSLPSASFSFGSCPSVPLNATPTHELGPFDYPIAPTGYSSNTSTAGPSSPRRDSLALGMTHRRGSIVSRSPIDTSATFPPEPPATRRSSTCSTITTLPGSGRRPSILHSASTNSGAPPPPTQSPTSSRRSSLLFPQKPLVAPIPPSLLARRGSLPAAQLFGLPSSEYRMRNSISGQTPHAQAGYSTTTPALYHRRASVLSDDGSATSSKASSAASSSTVVYNQSRRESFRLDPNLSPSNGAEPPSPTRAAADISSFAPRRPSYPHPPPTLPSLPQPHLVDRRRKMSNGSRLSGPSFSSSEGSAEEGEDGGESDDPDSLPTPGTAHSGFGGFTDPWARAGAPAKRAEEGVTALLGKTTVIAAGETDGEAV